MTRRPSIFLGSLFALGLFSSRAAASPPAPTQPVFSNIQATSLTFDWQDLSAGPTIQYIVEVSSAFADTPFSSTTVLLTSTFSALNVNAHYFARVQAQDTTDSSTSAFTTTIDTYTLANPPVSLSTTIVSFAGVGLTWDGNGNPADTLFSVERSTDGISFASVVTQTGISYTDQSIILGTSYVYRVQAFNNPNVPTVYSDSVSITTPGNASLPKVPEGFSLTRTKTGVSTFQIDFQWHRVTLRTDNNTLNNLDGYLIYQSTSLLAPRSQWVVVSTVTTESWTTTTDGSVSYYALKTLDTNGQTSDWSRALDDSSDLNQFFMAADFTSRLQLPQSAAAILRRENNHYGSDLDIAVTEITADETGRVVKSLQFKIFNTDTGNEVTDLSFNPPVIRGTIAFTVVADPLSLFWFNGNEWVKTTGLVSTADNTVSFTGSRAGRYQIRAASHVSGLIMTREYPKIITPNGDGWNDKAIFQFDNPQLSTLSGKIYDISNALVAELKPGPDPDTTLEWDGKDSGGKVVPGGIYIYQIEQAGNTASGTVVVAR